MGGKEYESSKISINAAGAGLEGKSGESAEQGRQGAARPAELDITKQAKVRGGDFGRQTGGLAVASGRKEAFEAEDLAQAGHAGFDGLAVGSQRVFMGWRPGVGGIMGWDTDDEGLVAIQPVLRPATASTSLSLIGECGPRAV